MLAKNIKDNWTNWKWYGISSLQIQSSPLDAQKRFYPGLEDSELLAICKCS